MTENKSLLGSGAGMVARNKRYIIWFYLLNLFLGLFGTVSFVTQARTVLDHSLHADRLLHGFDLAVFGEMFARPEFGPSASSGLSALLFSVAFFLATALFLPGVLQGYASPHGLARQGAFSSGVFNRYTSQARLPRDEFFRACGRNLWRFFRLLIVFAIVAGIVSGLLFAARAALVRKTTESTIEVLPFSVSVASLFVIFLVMTVIRIWFDLAQTDVVLSDQGAVRKSIAAGFRHTWRSLFRLWMSYFVISVGAGLVLLAGIWVWLRFVPTESVFKAFLAAQATLLLLLIPRFWQRAVAVAYYEENMVPVVALEPIEPILPEPPPVAVVPEPLVPPLIPPTPIAPQES
jgi:hypothetical protein